MTRNLDSNRNNKKNKHKQVSAFLSFLIFHEKIYKSSGAQFDYLGLSCTVLALSNRTDTPEQTDVLKIWALCSSLSTTDSYMNLLFM